MNARADLLDADVGVPALVHAADIAENGVVSFTVRGIPAESAGVFAVLAVGGDEVDDWRAHEARSISVHRAIATTPLAHSALGDSGRICKRSGPRSRTP